MVKTWPVSLHLLASIEWLIAYLATEYIMWNFQGLQTGIQTTSITKYIKVRELTITSTVTWCGRNVMRLATLCMNRQRCCLPLHKAVRLTPAVDSVQV